MRHYREFSALRDRARDVRGRTARGTGTGADGIGEGRFTASRDRNPAFRLCRPLTTAKRGHGGALVLKAKPTYQGRPSHVGPWVSPGGPCCARSSPARYAEIKGHHLSLSVRTPAGPVGGAVPIRRVA